MTLKLINMLDLDIYLSLYILKSYLIIFSIVFVHTLVFVTYVPIDFTCVLCYSTLRLFTRYLENIFHQGGPCGSGPCVPLQGSPWFRVNTIYC